MPADWSVRRGRDAYLAENGFTVEAYDEPWTQASFFAIDFAVPNNAAHKAAIKLHDLHHVATGFGTDLAGEGEISAWELRGGLRGAGLYVSAIIAAGAMMGLLVAPRRTVAAFRRAKGARSLWTGSLGYADLLERTVGGLRAEVGAPPTGLASAGQRLHKNAPKPAETRGGPTGPALAP